jgi:hypothetical protein
MLTEIMTDVLLHSGLYPSSRILNTRKQNTTFWKLDLIVPSGDWRETHSVHASPQLDYAASARADIAHQD